MPLSGVQLEIENTLPNPSGQPAVIEGPGGFRLTEFVDDFAYSQDVTLGGKAAAYFDIFTGEVSPEAAGSQSISQAAVVTDGPPRLRITPFPDSRMTAATKTISGNQLWVINADVTSPSTDPAAGQALAESKKFDFLLNYLVARGGIPRKLKKAVPGMVPPLPPLTTERIKSELDELGEVVAMFGHLTPAEVNAKIDGTVAILEFLGRTTFLIELSAACSDSHYP